MTMISLFATAAICTRCGQQTETPTLELNITEGPNFSEDDNMCYYRIEATVTGTPDPEIEFSDDENVSLLDPDLAEVGVDIGDSYILTATAVNDSGTANASITLSGECEEETAEEETNEEETDGEEEAEEEEAAEEITEEETYEEEAEEDEAEEEETEEETDEDEDDEEDHEPVGDSGGEETVTTLSPTSESCYLVTDLTEYRHDGRIIVGDTNEDMWVVGFLNFDMRTIGGTINHTTLHIENIYEKNNASEFGPLIIIACYLGEEIEYIPTEGGLTELHYSDDQLRDYIQYVVDNGNDDCNISFTLQGTRRARFGESESMNGVSDQFIFELDDVTFTIGYSH